MLKKLYLFVGFLLFVQLKSEAQIVVDNNTHKLQIGRYVSVLRTDKPLPFSQVIRSEQFRPSNSDLPNLGLSSAGKEVWVRFSVNNKSSTPEMFLELAYPLLDEVEFFVGKEGEFHRVLAGQKQPFNIRKYNHPDYIFDIQVPQNRSATYYLRIKSSEPVVLPLTLSRSQELWESINLETFLMGIFVGIVLIMIAYNLFIFLSIRDESYLYYIFHVAFVGLMQAAIKGYNFQYLWPDSPSFESKTVILFGSLAWIGAVLFTISFLKVKTALNKLYLPYKALTGFFLVAILSTIAGGTLFGFLTLQVSTGLFLILVTVSSYKLMSEGFSPAKCFFAAWLFTLAGWLIFMLKDYNLLPYNVFTSHSFIFGLVIEMVFLSFGLAIRIRGLKDEKEKFKDESLRIAYQNERIIREQNILLEQMVKRRTSELNEANSELSSTLNNLQIAQSQLLESEKMASLGFLSRGIAHEINNPINFITSNITPLKRDVNTLFDFITTLEELNYSKISIADKKQQISEYKEKADFHYLQSEIGNILNAMTEGSQRTIKILDSLRIFSRVYENDLRKVNINEGIDSTLIVLNNLLSRISIVKHYGSLPLVECYPGKLNQVFLNIIINSVHAISVKFGKQAAGEIIITTSCNDQRVTVKIKDNGIGMEEEISKQVFDPFFTTKDFSGGAGLGMSIAYNTVCKHNGQIYLNSVYGEGTEFTVELPLTLL